MRKLLLKSLKDDSIVLEKNISNMKMTGNSLTTRLDSKECDNISIPKDRTYKIIVQDNGVVIFDRIGEFNDYVFQDEYNTTISVENQEGVETREHRIISNDLTFKNITEY